MTEEFRNVPPALTPRGQQPKKLTRNQAIALLVTALLAILGGGFAYWFTQVREVVDSVVAPAPSPPVVEEPSPRERLNEHRVDGYFERPKTLGDELREAGARDEARRLELERERCAEPKATATHPTTTPTAA